MPKAKESKMNQATDLVKRDDKSTSPVQFPAIGSGKMVTIDPKNIRSFDDVGLGTGLFPDDMQIPMSDLVGLEVVVVDAKIGLKGEIAGKVTEYGVVRMWAEKTFKFLPEGKPDFEDEYVTVEQGTFYTTATGGVVAYRQVCAALGDGTAQSPSLLPLRATVLQAEPKAKGMNGYYYFGKAVNAKK